LPPRKKLTDSNTFFKESKEKLLKARQLVEDIVKENKVVYGITTGFGKFAKTVIDREKLE
jgi:histidine ammonia-lyase